MSVLWQERSVRVFVGSLGGMLISLLLFWAFPVLEPYRVLVVVMMAVVGIFIVK